MDISRCEENWDGGVADALETCMYYDTKFRRSRSNRLGVGQGSVAKIFGTLGPAPLDGAWLTSRNMLLPDICYNTWSNCLGVRMATNVLGEAGRDHQNVGDAFGWVRG